MKSQRFWILAILICALCVLPRLQPRALGQPAAENAPAAPVDTGWPRTHVRDGQTVVVYQPQVDDWKDHKSITFRAAVAMTPLGATEPVYGVVNAQADTIVDRDARNVYMTNIQCDAKFPGKNEEEQKKLQAMVLEVMMGQSSVFTVSLDRVLACVSASEAAMAKPITVPVNLDPPPIYYSETPAVLVIYGGAPQFKPIAGTRLSFAVNTNWDVIQDPASSKYYLLDDDSWLTAPDPVKGPWTVAGAGSLPADLYNLPSDPNWEQVRKHVPGTPAASAPKVVVSTVPAELIVTDGRAQASPIPGTALQQVVNPKMPLFYDNTDQNYYYLVAGRWFKTKALPSGAWAAASTDLPGDFGKIPPDSDAGEVLASVPGTLEAKDAVLLAAVPQKATIDISKATVNVTYDGAPQFVPITGTSMTYAVNTPNQVILADAKYYCCFQGVWFVAPTATGPWVVCTSVAPVIYTIPPTSPVYNVTYVQVYGYTPTTVVVGYTSGYSGEYVAANGALMFGAGVAVGAVLANNSHYYYPYPAPYYSYGCAATYSYGYGAYHTGAAYYGPYGGAGYSASYNAATGTYSRSAAAYGAYGGSASVHQAYNPYTNTGATHATASNGYDSWGASAVSHNGNYATAEHETYANGAKSGSAESSNGKGGNAYQTAGGATVAKTNNGNVYAADNGKTYSSNGQNNTNQAKSGSGQSYDGKNGSAYQTAGGATVAKSNDGETYAAKDGKTASGSEQTNANGSKSGSAEGSDGKGGSAYQTKGGADVGKTNSGDVYAGKDGNVYKKSDSGDWQQHTSSGWQNASHSDTTSQLDKESQARSQGNAQAERSSSFHGGGGGGFHGGGRR